MKLKETYLSVAEKYLEQNYPESGIYLNTDDTGCKRVMAVCRSMVFSMLPEEWHAMEEAMGLDKEPTSQGKRDRAMIYKMLNGQHIDLSKIFMLDISHDMEEVNVATIIGGAYAVCVSSVEYNYEDVHADLLKAWKEYKDNGK